MNIPEIEGFEIIENVGSGGMASVWKARQLSLDRIVAIKVLYSDFTSDPADVERFKVEAQTAARLKHQGIVQVYDAHLSEAICYFVMEYVSGYTVGEWLARKGPLSAKEALLVAQCVAEALSYAWDTAQIIHCDIKPDNILVDADGTVKVSDLGLARTLSMISSAVDTDIVMGTPQYVAPEQAMGEANLDCRTDVYSLGAMMYHMSTGRMPFEGYRAEEIMDMQVTHTIPDPVELNPKLPRQVAWLIEKMMCKSREGRQQTWQEVLSDIERVRKGHRPSDVPPDGASTVTRSAKRAKKRMLPTQISKKNDKSTLVMRIVLLTFLLLAIIFAYNHLRYLQRVDKAAELRRREASAVVPEREEIDPSAPVVGDPGKALFDVAENWLRAHPRDIAGATERYRAVVTGFPGSPSSQLAMGRIEKLEARKSKVAELLDSLASLAEPLVEVGAYSEAAHIYESYRGLFSAETAAERDRRAAEIHSMAQAAAHEDVPIQAPPSLATLLDETVEMLLKQNMVAAKNALIIASEDERLVQDREKIMRVLGTLTTASRADENIKASFSSQAGKEIMVQFRSGQKRLRIVAVRGDRIVAKMIRDGQVSGGNFDFSVKQLGYLEILRRLGDDSVPGIALAKGLLALRAGSSAYARRYFAKVDPLLAERLVASVQ